MKLATLIRNPRQACVVTALLLTAGLVAAVQDEKSPSQPLEIDAADLRAFVELVRSDIKTEKAIVLSQNMELTEDQALEFWPLYREYDLELNGILDQRLAVIKRYINTYDMLTEEQARRLADDALSLEEKRTALKRKYFKKFAKVITAKKAARFFQIENQINAAIDLRIAASLPLIK